MINEYNVPFNKFICSPNYKSTVAVTKSQSASIVSEGRTHDEMRVTLIKNIRPDIKIDSWGNAINPNESFYNGNLFVLSEPSGTLVELSKQELLSAEQFECLKEILLLIKDYNETIKNRGYGRIYTLTVLNLNDNIDIKSGDYEQNIDELITLLGNNITDDYELANEVIIGREFELMQRQSM